MMDLQNTKKIEKFYLMDEEEKEYFELMKDSMCLDIFINFNINIKDLKIYKFDFTKTFDSSFYYYVATFSYLNSTLILFLFYDTDVFSVKEEKILQIKDFIKNYFTKIEKLKKPIILSTEFVDTTLGEKMKKISKFIETYYYPLLCDYIITVEE